MRHRCVSWADGAPGCHAMPNARRRPEREPRVNNRPCAPPVLPVPGGLRQ
ncbi:hypothetical protein CU044_3170 [Streptomyces sp. L-9-10]|nr:hypothetical protein CU044_3170 [Streptomyces sp. L-9-10]